MEDHDYKHECIALSINLEKSEDKVKKLKNWVAGIVTMSFIVILTLIVF